MGLYDNGNMDKALTGKRKNPLVDDIVDKPSLAGYLDQTEETITNWQKEHGLPFISVGRQTFFSVKSVYKWVMEKEQTLLSEKELKKEGLTKRSKGLDKIEI
ncbi:hypothetical protein ES703_110945 [subsurface metagenome]